MSFVKWKFNQMLVVGTMTMAVNYVVMLSGSVIVGNLVGAEGLAALNVCTPAFGIASFLASLLSVGTALVFSRAMGAFDERRAAGVFSQSFLLSILTGLLIYAAMKAGGGLFLDSTGVTGTVRLEAERYWTFQSLAMALLPLVLLLEALVYADGDAAVAALAGVVHVSGAISLSIWSVRLTGGAHGVAVGTAITMVAILPVCALHLFRKNNHLKFRFALSAADFRETLAASLADSTIYLCWGILIFIVNRFTIAHYGQYLLPVVALTASVVEFSIVFDGVGEALIPVGGMYAGERNLPALRTLAGHSALVATLEGAVCGILLFVLAPQISALYGFDPGSFKLFQAAVDAVRILALAMPFMGLLMMMNTHYLIVRHTPFAVSVTIMKDLVCPCAGVLLLGRPGSHWGEWIWVGFAAGYVVAATYPFLFVLFRHGRALFPWLIERDDGRSIDFTVKLSERSLADAEDRIGEFLNGRGIFETGDILTTVAAAGRATIAANPRSAVKCEYFVSAEEENVVRLVIRDNGKPLASERGRYLNTLSCNRSECRFDIMPENEKA